MNFVETIDFDKNANVRKTSDGYLAASPRVARTGIQVYSGAELGRPDLDEVRVNRPEKVVFNRKSLNSYAHRPITLGHPDEPVTSDNWREYSIGHVGGEVMRDGDYIRVPILLMDKDAIEGVESGEIKQLSLGYQMSLDWKGGDDFDAEVQDIVANHLAVVPRARGGNKLSIGDKKRKKIMTNDAIKTTQVAVDGVFVEVTDAAAPIIQRYIKDVDKVAADAVAKIKEITSAKDDLESKFKKLEAEKVTLQKQLDEAKISGDRLDELVKERDAVIRVATKILGADETKGSTAELRKKIVLKKVGDAAKDWNDDQIMASFNTLDLSDEGKGPNPAHKFNVKVGDYEDQRAKAVESYTSYLADAWKPKSVEATKN